jgi:hypothetical protein
LASPTISHEAGSRPGRAATTAKSGLTSVAALSSNPAKGTASPWTRVAAPSVTARVWAAASSSAVSSACTRALTVTTFVGRSSATRPTVVVATSPANRASRTRCSNVIARVHRAAGM